MELLEYRVSLPQRSYEPPKATYVGATEVQCPPLWTKGQKICLEEVPTSIIVSIRKTEHLPYLR